MTIKLATANVGGLSAPSKMPTFGISLPATACKVGAKLRTVKGSVCSKCYACKGMYAFKNVKNALANRLAALDSQEWVSSMVFLKNKKQIVNSGLFRWHDSGDLQGMDHLKNIVAVAVATPEITHWLPTKEKGLIAKYRAAGNVVPSNLIIRLSGAMIDGPAPKTSEFTSQVTSDNATATCRAFENNGECGSCRMCWDSKVSNVIYLSH